MANRGEPLVAIRHPVYLPSRSTRFFLFAIRYSPFAIPSSPHFLVHLDDASQFRPLLVLAQQIAFLGGGEAALPGQAELVERGMLRGLLDAALEPILALERAALGGDEAEHDRLALGQHPQRPETAGALVVVFHEIAVHVDLVEQDRLHGLV